MKPILNFSIITCLLLFHLTAQTATVSGTVTDQNTGQALEGVNIVCGETGVTSDDRGRFTIVVPPGDTLKITHIAYEPVELVPSQPVLTVRLVPRVLEAPAVLVRVNRAVAGVTPVAFSALTPQEISTRYTVEDIPMILALEPGVYAYSESGNGTGYSYVSIRGFDQSRIAVLLDNVPLNDNESHQVYWVDHVDLLSDAQDVQIQRGIGNSLYGSSAFGGSINVLTRLSGEEPGWHAEMGAGSYNTTKFRLRTVVPQPLGAPATLVARFSQIRSDGYREHHGSLQRAFSLGLERRGTRAVHQFRALIGYERSHLAWDGIYSADINHREKRRAGYRAYIDDFLQQIYSLNSNLTLGPALTLSNTAYLVKGGGYYETQKSRSYDLDDPEGEEDRDAFRDFLYGYGLDAYFPAYLDMGISQNGLGFTRRKWIVNTYYGLIPVLTWDRPAYRLDLGGEFRFYGGDHFGELADFTNAVLDSTLGRDWYRYYRYLGDKTSLTAFTHLAYRLTSRIRVIGDLQFQFHRWTLDQKRLGHAPGHALKADWRFLNPRLGLVYSATEALALFVNYGQGRKEPADNQIIEADDVWSEPVQAAAEVIHNLEAGANIQLAPLVCNLNLYRIDYANEQLKNIDIEQEGEYEYYSATGTVHSGVEFEATLEADPRWKLGLNGSLSSYTFASGDWKGKHLPNVPGELFNAWVQYAPTPMLTPFVNFRWVGRQFLAADNQGEIEPYGLVDIGVRAAWRQAEMLVKVNNLLDTLYATYGYDWGGYYYYWPGATRNVFVSLGVRM